MGKGIKKHSVAIITGASSGIGRAIALDLARKYQARLVLNARDEALLQETATKVKELGGEAFCVSGTIAEQSIQQQLVESARSTFGGIDILVNNAGFAKPGKFQEITIDDWRAVFEVNVFAAIAMTYLALADLKKSSNPKIVNIASLAGKIAFPGSVCYASSKFALTGFSEGIAAELGREGLDVLTVCPGLVRTDFFRKNRNTRDITAIAEQKDIRGWVMKNLLSISSEQAAREIIAACEAGGCHEIVLTGVAKALERLAGVCPPAAWRFARMVPADR